VLYLYFVPFIGLQIKYDDDDDDFEAPWSVFQNTPNIYWYKSGNKNGSDVVFNDGAVVNISFVTSYCH